MGVSNDDTPDESEDLYLHYSRPEAIAWLLQSWQAYRNRGILPYSGGLANQPRVWTRAIQRLNARYAPIYERLLKEKYPKEGQGAKEEEDLLMWVQNGGDTGSLFDKIGERNGVSE